MTLLIVDDENALIYAKIIEDNFDSKDYVLITASSEEEAYIHIDKSKIDIAIVDLCINTNDKAGIDISNYIKNKDKSVVVILITAFPEKLDLKRAYELGVYFCITKSSEFSDTYTELANAVRNAKDYKERLAQLDDAKRFDLLKKFFDPRVLEQYEHNHLALLPRERTITIAFWDIRGFTTVTEALIKYPKLISDFLREFFNRSAEIVSRNEGVLDKFIGDGLMGLYGAFENDDDDVIMKNALKTVQTAFEIRNVFQVIYQEWLPKWRSKTNRPISIGIGCGINTGDCIVGLLGTDNRDHFTALGHEVNLTARIESSAHKDEIRISQRTYEIIQEYVDVVELEPLPLKHVNDSTKIYVVEKIRKSTI